MNKVEVLEEIIKQNGNCKGINCNECPLFGMCGHEGNDLQTAKEMLEDEKIMTKIKVLEKIIKQQGACGGIDCYECPLAGMCRDSMEAKLKVAKKMLEEV